MGNRKSRQHRGNRRTRRYGKWFVFGLFLAVLSRLGKRFDGGHGRRVRSEQRRE